MVAGSEVEEKVQMEVEDLYDCNTTLSTHNHTKTDPQYLKTHPNSRKHIIVFYTPAKTCFKGFTRIVWLLLPR